MKISKSMSYEQFIAAANKSFHTEWSPFTAAVSVVCVDGDYYEVDMAKETFGRLQLIAVTGYNRGALMSIEKKKFLHNLKNKDIELHTFKKDRCVIRCFKRVGMFYA